MGGMDDSLGNRIKAARQLAGYRNVSALAEAIGDRSKRGLKTTNLRQIERNQLVADYSDMMLIADACGLPIAFFTADFARLPEISEDPRKVIARETALALERARARREGKSSDSPPLREAGQ